MYVNNASAYWRQTAAVVVANGLHMINCLKVVCPTSSTYCNVQPSVIYGKLHNFLKYQFQFQFLLQFFSFISVSVIENFSVTVIYFFSYFSVTVVFQFQFFQ